MKGSSLDAAFRDKRSKQRFFDRFEQAMWTIVHAEHIGLAQFDEEEKASLGRLLDKFIDAINKDYRDNG